MPELSDILPSFFLGGDKNDPRVNSALRQKMALAMMAQKRAFPKTVGEGLSAVGDAIGERSMMRQLMDADLAQQGDALKGPGTATAVPVASSALPPAVAGAMNYAPEGGGAEPAPVQAPPEAVQPAPVAALPDAAVQPPPMQPPAETYTPPTPEQTAAARNTIAAQLLARQQGGGGAPPPNPLLAGSAVSGAAPLPSSPDQAGSPPDQRLALNAPQDARGAVTDIRPAPPVPSQIRKAPPPQQVAQTQQYYPPGYVPPAAGAPPGAPVIPPSAREMQIQRWLASRQGNPYAATAVAPELNALVGARTQRQNEANEFYKAQLLRGNTQEAERIKAQTGQAENIQKWTKGQQDLIAGGAGGAPGQGPDPRLGTPVSPQRTGIPAAPPVPPGATPQEWAKEQAPRMAKAIDAVEKATPQFDDMIKTLKLAAAHPGREWGVGPASEIAKRTPGTAAYGFGKIMEQIGGKNFLNAYQQLKGGGSITEVEGTKAEAAQARLATAQNKNDFDKAMLDFESAVRQDMETIQRKVNRPVTAWQSSNTDAPAPDIGQVGQRRGRLQEYIGGNPALDESYRPIR